MQDFMLDLETLGSRPGCVILSIGIRAFDPKKGLIGRGLYLIVSHADCLQSGLFEEKQTLNWWERQSEEARKVLIEAGRPTALPLSEALENVNLFIKQHCDPRYAKIWGNGSDFDNAIIAHCYHVLDKQPIWSFWNNRCYRTLKSIFSKVPMERTGTFHNALDDATTQAVHANAIFKFISEGHNG